jgi:hypothetical protein
LIGLSLCSGRPFNREQSGGVKHGNDLNSDRTGTVNDPVVPPEYFTKGGVTEFRYNTARFRKQGKTLYRSHDSRRNKRTIDGRIPTDELADCFNVRDCLC